MKRNKILSIIMTFAIVISNFTIVSASEKILESDELLIPAQIGAIWEEDGFNYTVVDVLHVVWDETKDIVSSDKVSRASAVPITITVSIGYIGNGKINCIISASGGLNALLKYINGTISTWGVAGTHSGTTFSDSNLIPMSRITAEVTFNYLYLLESGIQYTETQGSVTDVFGNTGSFGPSVGSATIYP